MTLLQILAGTTGQLLSTAAVLTLLILITFMSVRLQRRYRKHRVYRLLNTALCFSLTHQALMLLITMYSGIFPAWLNLAAIVLQVLSFLIINFVVLELYTKPRRLDHFLFIAGLGVTIALTIFEVIWNPDLLVSGNEHVSRPLSLDIFAVVIVYMGLQFILPRIGQRRTYGAGVITYFTFLLVHAINHYLFQDAVAALTIVTFILPILYFTLLFILMFEWVIERLQSIYVSSITDGLTGLYNRQHFMKKAQQYISHGHTVTFLFCDLDHFKKLNDTHGHHYADGVLKQVATILANETDGIGTAGRYGGEELVAAIYDPRSKPELVAETIRARIESETPVTVSIGWSTAQKQISVQDVIHQADQAMYHSKTTGKNKVTAYKDLKQNVTSESKRAQLTEPTQPLSKLT
ncbi:GGDEF domain-containing protein [Paenibacillus abyssi]|uniref:GGDEF domain-containing protein n=1 Tax=Paenibacillus abyssi TaxID=1340531 RepID=A0A917LDG6_9BACL|nr:GGDEF domain-containing protein [Paenibacillus abyssi]GGG14868.1 hypothetical protein GCM10010916_34720 [Paenibacillus abyssi]